MMSIRLTLALLAVVALLALPASAAAQNSSVTGTVAYRERIALPPEAVVTVQLVDISIADAAASVLAQQAITASGKQPPFQFDLRYDPARVKQNGTYAVQASIRVGTQSRFISTTPYLVITQGRPSNVNLVLTQAGGSLPYTAGADTLLLALIALLLTLFVVRSLRVRLAHTDAAPRS